MLRSLSFEIRVYLFIHVTVVLATQFMLAGERVGGAVDNATKINTNR